MERTFPGGQTLRLAIGDITRMPADVIVNAANSALAGGGGVDGAIHSAGGPSIMQELDRIRPGIGGRCATGGAVATGAGKLPAKWVFHAVGPIYRDGRQGEPGQLASCYRTCLEMAGQRGAASVNFPSLSTGAYGYPVDEAARIALSTVSEHLSRPGAKPLDVTFVLFDQRTCQAYAAALALSIGSATSNESEPRP
jgi:O-acetyl-ADP-ribose deacetylase (regulator of RNase III)